MKIEEYLIQFDMDDEPLYMRCAPHICEPHSCEKMRSTMDVIYKHLLHPHGIHFAYQGGRWYAYQYPTRWWLSNQVMPVGTATTYDDCLAIVLNRIKPSKEAGE